MNAIRKGQYLLPSFLSGPCRAFVQACLQVDPKKRPSTR